VALSVNYPPGPGTVSSPKYSSRCRSFFFFLQTCNSFVPKFTTILQHFTTHHYIEINGLAAPILGKGTC
jgi:hypothetical protein